MLKRILNFLLRFTLVLTLLCIIGLFAPKFVMWLFAQPRIYTVEEVAPTRVAIVFGAGLLPDGSAGVVLSDRVQTAVYLYQQGKVQKLLMSGDNSTLAHNEPEAMRQYALDRGVPDEAIVLDYAGRRTYDTCYRAKHIFQVEQAILITQEFHMPRALVLCNWFGINSLGVEANNRYFLRRSHVFWNIRELLATFQAMWDLLITKPIPILGEVEPIQ
jgi:SanA protein